MPRLILAVALIFTLARNVVAIPWEGPQQTEVGNAYMGLGWSPMPTQAPGFDSFGLFKRELSPLCGYVNENGAEPYTCRTGYNCALNTYNGVFGCCGTASALDACTIGTTCLNSAQVSTACDDTCSSDAFTVKCTDPGFTLCNVFTYFFSFSTAAGTQSVTAHFCNSVADFQLSLYQSTTGGGGVTTPVVSHSTPTPVPPTTTTPTQPSSSPSISSTSTVPPNPTNSSTSGSKTPVGAIAGGVVGGLAVIVLGILGFFLIRKKNKNKNNNEPPPGDYQNPGQGPQYPPVAGAAAGGYNGYNEQKPAVNAQYPSGGQQYPYGGAQYPYGGAQYPPGGGAPTGGEAFGAAPASYYEQKPPEMEGNYPPPQQPQTPAYQPYQPPQAQAYLQPDPLKTASAQPTSPVSANSQLGSPLFQSQRTSPSLDPVQPAAGAVAPAAGAGVGAGGGVYKPTSELAGDPGHETYELPAISTYGQPGAR